MSARLRARTRLASIPMLGVLLAWTVSLSAGPWGVDDPETAARRERDRMQGVWTLESLEVNGARAADELTRTWMLVVEGDLYNPGSRSESVEYRFRLDPTRNPKAIDLIPREGDQKGRVLRGVYALTDDSLTICRCLGAEGERPAGFRTRPDSGLVTVVWKRRPAMPKADPAPPADPVQ